MIDGVETYLTLDKAGEGFYKEKGSKFIAYAVHCKDQDRAKAFIDQLWKDNHGACHVCFAWRFGIDQFTDRFSDDGEPNNSAGKPIFGQIQAFEVTNVLIAVVRYYGGTNLGVGGLIHAYKTAAKEALEKAKIVTRTLENFYKISYDYAETGGVMVILNKLNAAISDQTFENNQPVIYFSLPKSDTAGIEERFAAFQHVEIEYLKTA